MVGSFPQELFVKLLETLAKTPGASLSEEPRRKVLEDFFKANDINTVSDRAGNLWIYYGSGSWSESVIFDAHLDVVQNGYISKVRYEDGKIKGMGIGDNLTAVAMLAMYIKALTEKGILFSRPLKVLFSVGEEGDGNLKGVRQVVADNPAPPYLFISYDLSFEQYSVAALGSKRYRVRVKCPGGHSWDDYGTPGAIEQFMDFFYALKAEFSIVVSRKPGSVSFNHGIIRGGEGINSIARFAEATFEFRSVFPEIIQELDQAVMEIINGMNKRSGVFLDYTITGERPAATPVKPERIEPAVIKLLEQTGTIPASVPRSTNINIPLKAGWPSICLGLCRGGRFHSKDEYVELDSLTQGWDLLKGISNTFLM